MTNEELKPHLNKRVTVTNRVGGGVYSGVLVGFKPSKFAINNLVIHNSEGGSTASKVDTSRWFTTEKCEVALDEPALRQA